MRVVLLMLGKVYYVAINIETGDSAYEHSVISASIAADAVNGNIPTNQVGQPSQNSEFYIIAGSNPL